MQGIDCTETAKIFSAGQTVKTRAGACGGLDGKPARLIVVAISEAINLCTIRERKAPHSPSGAGPDWKVFACARRQRTTEQRAVSGDSGLLSVC